MENIRVPRIMTATSRRLMTQGRSIGFVPTMGALHDGHMFLVKRARMDNDVVVVSIFVNPTQFGANEDFDKYPRDLDADRERLMAAGADILFAPDVQAMYPEGSSTTIEVGDIAARLCGEFRPGHFRGVATVVNKLFNIVMPTRAYFGQKDFQQTRVIEQMVLDLNMNVEFISCPTVREADGLAMSSRNQYLSEDERLASAVIFKTLNAAAAMLKEGALPPDVSKMMDKSLRAEPLVKEIQYAAVYDPKTLEQRTEAAKACLLAIALKIGNTRLIDNMLVEV